MKLAVATAAPPAPPAAPPPPPVRPATPAIDTYEALVQRDCLLAASHLVQHGDCIRAEREALAAFAAAPSSPAPASAPPPVAPVAPVAPAPKPRTWRDHYEEVRVRDPYQAAAVLLQAHSTAGSLDAPLPVTP